MALNVIHDRCPRNHRCPAVRVCPFGALTQNGFDAPVVDLSKCTGCGKCARVCPTGALMLSKDAGTIRRIAPVSA